MTESWRPVPGYEGLYEVSDQGRVRSLRRNVVLRPSTSTRYLVVMLYKQGVRYPAYVHHLVLEAFDGPRPDGQECLHGDGNPHNCERSNLRWGTSSENKLDQVRQGTHYEASRTHCDAGHPFDEENSFWNGRQRWCRACQARRSAEWRERNARSDRQCSEDNCSTPPVAKGLCMKHYRRQWKANRTK